MSKKKINVWGSKLPYTTVELNGGSTPGTTNYNDLTNKPQINGQELVGNTDLNNTYYTKQEINDSFYNKDEVDTKISELNQTINQLNSNLTSLINEKTSAQAHYLKNKAQLIEGNDIHLVFDDQNNTIIFDVTEVPAPPQPTADGIYSYDSIKNIYRKYDEATIFVASGDVAYCEGNGQNIFPDRYDHLISRNIFNEPLIFIYKNLNEQTINNLFVNCLANCFNFNQSLDFQNVDNLTSIGNGFLYSCINFNSSITFKEAMIKKIGDDFMHGCESFNNNLNNLFTIALKEIRINFMQGCKSFNQIINLADTSLDNGGSEGYNKVMLVNFMYMCNMFSIAKLILGDKGTNVFKKTGYNSTYILGMQYCFGTNNNNAPSYVNGFNIEGSNITKEALDNFVIYTTDSIGVTPFKNSNEGPCYKKVVVNGVSK